MDFFDSDSDSDDESQIQDLQQLDAVLEENVSSMPERNLQGLSASQGGTSTSSVKDPEEYARIELAIALNKETEQKLDRLELLFTNRLKECRARLKELQESPLPKQEKQVFRYVSCGKPYFRDADNFPAPDNQDTIMMAKAGMYDFSQVTTVPGWTSKDKRNFLNAILEMSRELKKNELTAELDMLRRDFKEKKGKNKSNKITALRNELDKVRKKSLNEIALPIDTEYDWDAISSKLNYRHSPQEYRSLWRLYLHPSNNKTNWSRAEHLLLQKMSHTYSMQDWDEIAKQLNTGRTGYQCFVYFRTNMSNTFTGQKWTKEEEEYLKRLIDYYREDEYIPWGRVAASMENRTKIQIYNKYSRMVEQRKGRFLPEEDAVILTCVEKIGPNFKRIARYLPGRSAAQLRARYHVLEKRSRTSIVWTAEEDRKLIQLVANQDSTVNYSTLTEHFPGKNRMHLRTRYMTLYSWMKKFPNRDIAYAPRRGARRLGHGQASSNLNKAVENLKKRIESDIEKKKSNRITMDSPEEDIDDAIIAIMVNEKIRQDELKQGELIADPADDEDDPVMPRKVKDEINLHRTLIFLKAKLNKDKFMASPARQEYPTLVKLEQEPSTVKVKSYSRKSSVSVVDVGENPDIWGKCVLPTSDYVLPPNYATITGLKRLMEFVSNHAQRSEDIRHINVGIMTRRNNLMKTAMDDLMDRFQKLFMWPMMLSNVKPTLENMPMLGCNQDEAESVEPGLATKVHDKKISTASTSKGSKANYKDINMKFFIGSSGSVDMEDD